MTDTDLPPPRRLPRWLLPAGIAVLLLAGAGAWGWQAWQRGQADEQARSQAAAVQLNGLLATVEALRRDQRATSQRVQDAATTNRVLRDEVLGLGQRSALLEDNLAKLADSTRQGTQALHRDEAELLLAQAAQRLAYADDVEGAQRLYALAAVALADLPDSEALNLRQALIQERAALDALGPGPRTQARQRLDAVAAALPTLPLQADAPAHDGPTPWWQTVLAPFVEITPTRLNGPLTDADRRAGQDALQVELTLARAAIERGDDAGKASALGRVDQWLNQLWPDSPALRIQRAELQALRMLPLQRPIPELGSTLQQLRALRDRR